jgi:hypothetical protein
VQIAGLPYRICTAKHANEITLAEDYLENTRFARKFRLTTRNRARQRRRAPAVDPD